MRKALKYPKHVQSIGLKAQITQAVQNDPYSLEQLNAYLKEIYADQSRKIAWKDF